MNIASVLPYLLLCVALAFAGAWVLAFFEARRLRARNDELNERILTATSQLSQVSERARNLEEARTLMSEQFQLVSHEAMEKSANSLLQRAEETFTAREKLAMERMDSSLKPVSETLTRFEAQVKAMEEARATDKGGLTEQIGQLLAASNETRDVTQKLATALRRGAGVQGRWGEETLRNVLQAAGLTRFDFIEQHNLDTDEGRRRPDVVVRMPGDKSNAVFVIDSKVNLSAYLEAAEATDDLARETHLRRHAQGLRNHIKDLSAKAYWDQFASEGSPDFVAMFVPGDGFLAAALDRLPDLMTEAMDRRVLLVTPTTLFALCKAVAYGWRAEDQAKNAAAIVAVGRELYKRIAVMGAHAGSVGKALEAAVGRYNQFVGSLESQVLTQARRFEDLSVDHEGKEIGELTPVEGAVRPLIKLAETADEPSVARLQAKP